MAWNVFDLVLYRRRVRKGKRGKRERRKRKRRKKIRKEGKRKEKAKRYINACIQEVSYIVMGVCYRKTKAL